MMDKILHLMQVKLGKLEKQELEEIMQHSQDEAVRISLLLASQPAPPMPQFFMDPKYANAEKLADAINDRFSNMGAEEELGASWEKGFDDKANSMTDAEAFKACSEWKNNYSVVMGVSWGSLPYDLQQKWMQYSCDYLLDKDAGGELDDRKSQRAGNLVTKEEYAKESSTNKEKDLDDILGKF